MDTAEVVQEVTRFMGRLATRMERHFPHHAVALRAEISAHLTMDRWNKVAAVLASLGAVPGVALREAEHVTRGIALSAVAVAQKMAAMKFAYRERPEDIADFVSWLLGRLSEELDQGR